jgi:transcriptional regulator of met regulon
MIPLECTAAESVSVNIPLEVAKCFVQARTFVNVRHMKKITETEAIRTKIKIFFKFTV